MLLALQGLMANLLPRQIFLRLSVATQAIVLCGLILGYLLEPSLESLKSLTAPRNHRVLEWLPAYWFLGIFQQINGTMHPSFGWLARRGWIALGLSIAAAVLMLLLSYLRMMPKVLEQPEIVPAGRLRWNGPLGDSLETTITLFSARTLLRSRQHRMILGIYVGIGLAIVLGYVSARAGSMTRNSGVSTGALFVALVLVALAAMAMRVVAALPITLKANWVFRVAEVRDADAYRRAVRYSWIAIGTATVGTAVTAISFGTLPWRTALEHVVICLLFGMLLVEVCLFSFLEIPFTCSYLPGKANVHIAFWASLVLGLWGLDAAARFEGRMLEHPSGWAALALGLGAALAGIRWLSRLKSGRGAEIRYEEEYPAVVTSLNLR